MRIGRVDIKYTCPECLNVVWLNRVQTYVLDMRCAFCDRIMKCTIDNEGLESEPRS